MLFRSQRFEDKLARGEKLDHAVDGPAVIKNEAISTYRKHIQPMCESRVRKQMDDNEQQLHNAVERLKYVDTCLSIYKKTIDKKAADVTVRENDQIKACKSLDSYPPAK